MQVTKPLTRIRNNYRNMVVIDLYFFYLVILCFSRDFVQCNIFGNDLGISRDTGKVFAAHVEIAMAVNLSQSICDDYLMHDVLVFFKNRHQHLADFVMQRYFEQLFIVFIEKCTQNDLPCRADF